jgi:hypothetical protein
VAQGDAQGSRQGACLDARATKTALRRRWLDSLCLMSQGARWFVEAICRSDEAWTTLRRRALCFDQDVDLACPQPSPSAPLSLASARVRARRAGPGLTLLPSCRSLANTRLCSEAL